jgi:hypothetical protein
MGKNFVLFSTGYIKGINIMQVFSLILLGVMLNTAAQLMLKAGMTQIGHFEFSSANMFPIGMKIIANPPIISGCLPDVEHRLYS